MPIKITQKKLILFIYNELNPIEMDNIKLAIRENETVNAKYKELVGVISPLDSLWQSPNPTSLKIIDQEAHDGFGQIV